MEIKEIVINEKLNGFVKILSAVDVDSLPMLDYTKRYLKNIINHKVFYCRTYADLLVKALQHSDKPIHDCCLLDFGAGNGLMGLLAKYCGFKKVFINDLNPGFLHAARELARAMGIKPDGFIEGGIKKVKEYFVADYSYYPDVIVGSDVIEHIYDLDFFFQTVQEINPNAVTSMNTACNPYNYLKVQHFKKIHLKDEWIGGEPGDHSLFPELATSSFFTERKRIIGDLVMDKMNKISYGEIDTLVRRTRGMRKDDIEKAVEKYEAEKVLPEGLSHPTNTCDPISGSWSERMLTFNEYRSIYSRAGFALDFYNGFYNEFENTLKSRLLFFINRIIPFSFYTLAPFVTLVGKPKRKR